MTIPAPYPPDTRAKGWRFELDHERIRQSDTWALASPDVRPWLLMLWMVAWEQTPCGSMPNDDELIAARIGMLPKAFAKHRAILLRGWWAADDGRLYHDIISGQVLGMVQQRDKTAKRVAGHKAKMREQRVGNALPQREQHDENDTGTGTGTNYTDDYHPPFAGERARDTDSVGGAWPSASPGDLCAALKAVGISRVNPSHQGLRELLAAGASIAEFIGHADRAKGKADPFAYLLATVAGERKRAAAMGGEIHHGPLRAVNRQEAIESENRRVASEWSEQQEQGVEA